MYLAVRLSQRVYSGHLLLQITEQSCLAMFQAGTSNFQRYIFSLSSYVFSNLKYMHTGC